MLKEELYISTRASEMDLYCIESFKSSQEISI